SVFDMRYSILPVLKTKMRQTILHSITDIVAVAAGIMDMEKDKNRPGDSISRIRTVRRPRCRESSALPRLKRLLTKISPSPIPRTPTLRNGASHEKPDHSQNHTNRCPAIDNFRYRELQLEVEDGRHLFASWKWYGDRARSQVRRQSHLQHVGGGFCLHL